MNKAIRVTIIVCFISSSIFCTSLMSDANQNTLLGKQMPEKKLSPLQRHGSLRSLNKEDFDKVSSISESANAQDRSQIPSIIRVLQKPSQTSHAEAGLHALARMGAVEGLPIIQEYIESDTTGVGRYAHVAKARLLAESSTASIVGSHQIASAKIERFYRELNMNGTNLNAALTDFLAPTEQVGEDGRTYRQFSSSPPLPPIGVYAMRELADIMYHGLYKDYADLPQISGVNFQDDYPSALKVRLASLPQDERLPALINELANKKTLTPNDDYELQLAINEGKPAAELAAQKLLNMEQQHEQYTSAGFGALFNVLNGVGDQKQAPVLARFIHVPYPYVGHDAEQSYRNLVEGYRGEYKTGY